MPWRSIVVASSVGIPECLLFALEREFESIHVVEVDDVEGACAVLPYPVSLLLIDGDALEGAMPFVSQFSRMHPLAMVAVMVDNERRAAMLHRDVSEFDVIRGILPMNLKLDLWLSVVALMMRGGEYFPASTFRSPERRPVTIGADIGQQIAHAGAGERDHHFVRPRLDDAEVGARSAKLGALTEREFQVLQLVARGTQNKLIAVELGLSEHTVKIHIHNVIRKLGSRNRTEAAAMFLQSGMMRADHGRVPRMVMPPR